MRRLLFSFILNMFWSKYSQVKVQKPLSLACLVSLVWRVFHVLFEGNLLVIFVLYRGDKNITQLLYSTQSDTYSTSGLGTHSDIWSNKCLRLICSLAACAAKWTSHQEPCIETKEPIETLSDGHLNNKLTQTFWALTSLFVPPLDTDGSYLVTLKGRSRKRTCLESEVIFFVIHQMLQLVPASISSLNFILLEVYTPVVRAGLLHRQSRDSQTLWV